MCTCMRKFLKDRVWRMCKKEISDDCIIVISQKDILFAHTDDHIFSFTIQPGFVRKIVFLNFCSYYE